MRAVRILAIDQSTQLTGWAFFDDKGLCKIGLIDLHRNRDADARCGEMCREIGRLLEEWKPELVVFEDLVLQRSPKTLKLLAVLLGRALGLCEAQGIETIVLPASVWRRAAGLTGGRNTKRDEFKKRAIELAKAAYGIQATEDVAEAICMGMAAIAMLEDENDC